MDHNAPVATQQPMEQNQADRPETPAKTERDLGQPIASGRGYASPGVGP